VCVEEGRGREIRSEGGRAREGGGEREGEVAWAISASPTHSIENTVYREHIL
jgi:hypothetical protein